MRIEASVLSGKKKKGKKKKERKKCLHDVIRFFCVTDVFHGMCFEVWSNAEYEFITK